MNPAHVDAVQRSFAQIAPIAPQAAALFYVNLFEVDPSLRSLFQGDMQRQGERLMSMLGAAVKMLDKPGTLLPTLRALGARHAGYGVASGHYASVGTALLTTLEQGLGEAWTADVAQAWQAVYAVIRDTMLEGTTQLVEA
jgi:hemoglobin-like flavoprotein